MNSKAYSATSGAQVRREVLEIDMTIMREAMDKRVLGLPQARPHDLTSLPQPACHLEHARSRSAMAKRQRI